MCSKLTEHTRAHAPQLYMLIYAHLPSIIVYIDKEYITKVFSKSLWEDSPSHQALKALNLGCRTCYTTSLK